MNRDAVWGLPEQLLAGIFDALRTLVWLNSEDGRTGRNRPEPLPRPGVEAPESETVIGAGALSLEEMQAWLDERNPNQARR